MRAKYAFSASFPAIFLNPFYFCRKELFLAIRRNSQMITGKVLDVGCGTKPYQMLFQCSEYVGLEYDSPENRKNKKAEYFYDGIHFPFADNSFDSVLTTQVLEHVFTPEIFIQELHRIIKPGGYVLLTVPFVWPEHERPYDFGRYSSFGLNDLLQRNGFEVVDSHKTCADITLFFQLWNAVLLDWRGSNHWFLLELKFLLCSLSNIIGSCFRFCLPKNPYLYLDNVILIRKQ